MPLDTDTTTELEEKPDDTSIRSGLEAAFAEEATNSPSPAPAPAPGVQDQTSAPTPAARESDELAAAVPSPSPERAIPERLKARYGERWATLPPDVRDTFHEYESNIGRLASTYGKNAKQWEQTQQIFAPYAEMVQKEGGNFHGALSNLFETARILRQGSPEQKIVLLRQTAAAFGVPLEALVGQSVPGANGQITPAPQINEEMINRLNTLEREVLTTRAGERHNRGQQVDTEISTFIADPANIYVQEPGYLDTMAALIKAGKAADLPEAYKQAAWLHDRTRQLEIAKTTQQRDQAGRDAAARARRAASSLNGSAPGAVRVDPSKMSLRDTLVAAFDGELDT